MARWENIFISRRGKGRALRRKHIYESKNSWRIVKILLIKEILNHVGMTEQTKNILTDFHSNETTLLSSQKKEKKEKKE